MCRIGTNARGSASLQENLAENEKAQRNLLSRDNAGQTHATGRRGGERCAAVFSGRVASLCMPDGQTSQTRQRQRQSPHASCRESWKPVNEGTARIGLGRESSFFFVIQCFPFTEDSPFKIHHHTTSHK